jgi:hypothetical protein
VGDRAKPGHDTGVGPHVSGQRETALNKARLTRRTDQFPYLRRRFGFVAGR